MLSWLNQKEIQYKTRYIMRSDKSLAEDSDGKAILL